MRPIGEFERRTKLGEGIQGIVHRVRGETSDLAVKTVVAVTSSEKELLARELRVLRALGMLISLEFDNSGLIKFAMPFMGDMDLYSILKLSHYPSNEKKLKHLAPTILRDVVNALQYLHAGVPILDQRLIIIHGDIKPSNIVVNRRGRARLIDFGGAHIIPANQTEIADKLFCVTLSYMAPEIREKHLFSAASDIYALGVLIGGPHDSEVALTDVTKKRVAVEKMGMRRVLPKDLVSYEGLCDRDPEHYRENRLAAFNRLSLWANQCLSEQELDACDLDTEVVRASPAHVEIAVSARWNRFKIYLDRHKERIKCEESSSDGNELHYKAELLQRIYHLLNMIELMAIPTSAKENLLNNLLIPMAYVVAKQHRHLGLFDWVETRMQSDGMLLGFFKFKTEEGFPRSFFKSYRSINDIENLLTMIESNRSHLFEFDGGAISVDTPFEFQAFC